MDKTKSKQKLIKGVLSIIGGLSLHLMIGNFTLWANISGYVVAYFHNLGDENATVGNSLLVPSITTTVKNLIGPFGGYLFLRMNTRLLLIIASSICIGAVYSASLVESWNQFLIVYPFLFAFGIGINYWIPIFCAWEHFPNNKGLMTGIIMFAYGIGPSVFGLICNSIVNPDDLVKVAAPESPQKDCKKEGAICYFPEEVSDEVPKMFRFIATIWIGLAAVAILLISREKEYVEKRK